MPDPSQFSSASRARFSRSRRARRAACAVFACLLTAVVGLGAVIPPPAESTSAPVIQNPDTKPTKAPIQVATSNDNYPYSFVDDQGHLAGFAVDVFDTVARRMGLHYTRVIGPSIEVGNRFVAGELTVQPYFTRTLSRQVDADYSVPYVTLQMTLFVRHGDTRITAFNDLIRKPYRIMVGGAGSDYALAHGIPNDHLARASNIEALQQLSSGAADAAIFSRLVGLATAERYGLKNIEPSALALPDSSRQYSFAVRRGNSELLAQLNEGLAIIHRSGEFDDIYQKWFGRYESRRFTRSELVAWVAGALAVSLIIALWALVRQRQLRHHLARQAEELAQSKVILAEAQRFARVGHWQRGLKPNDPALWSDETHRIFERDPRLGPLTLEQVVELSPPADRAEWHAALQRARHEGVAYELDLSIEPRPGVRKAIHVRGRPIRDAAGRITGLFGTVQDITSWHDAEQALRQSEQLLRALYDNLPFAMGVTERIGGTWVNISLNPGALRLLGLTTQPEPGRTMSELGMDAAQQAFWNDLLERSSSAGAPVSSERHNPEKNRDYTVSVVPLGGTGERPRCCFFVEDITTRRQKDSEIAQGRRLRAIGELVGGIAHEFNNLLTPILLKSDMLQHEWQHEPVLCEDLKLIAETARRSADLTRRLLAFGRRTDAQLEVIRLRTVIESNFNLLRPTIDRRILLESELSPDLPPLYLNAGDVHQILLNLLLNARDTLVEKLAHHSRGDWTPSIQVRAIALPANAVIPLNASKAAPASQWIRLTCTDNGMGMAPAVIERVFEPFYTTKQVGQGTGLGLATVWHLVVDMGGRVEIESNVDTGTSFHVFLPVRPPPAGTLETPPPAEPFAAAIPAAQSPAPGALTHILLVEDEEPIALLLSRILRNLGYAVTHSANGQDAWEKLSAAPGGYDGVILDLNMPGITGLEFMRRARDLPYRRPIIISSGRITEADRQELKALRVDGIVQKPFALDALAATLSSVGL